MPTNIEMNILGQDGQYQTLYPNVSANSVVDFSGNNPLLSDSAKNLFGLSTDAVPSEVFQVLSNSVIVSDGTLSTPSGIEVPGITAVHGTYIGNGGDSVTLNFDFRPDAVLVGGQGDSKTGVITLLRGVSQNQIIGALNSYCFSFPNVSWGATSVTWKGMATVGLKANINGRTYRYWALGVK